MKTSTATRLIIRPLGVALFAGIFLLSEGRGPAAEENAARLCEPWESEYAKGDATGPHVVALWEFTPGAETEDASGHGHDLVLENAKINPDGRFGACLESFPGWPLSDQRHRATVKNDPSLSPQGPFTIELWIKPKKELNEDYPDSFLLDKKYVADDDYQLILGKADRYGSRVLRACLGFGADSSTYYSRPAKFEPGVWYHVAFTYDGAGTGSFYLNGVPFGSTPVDGRKSISPGSRFLSIGDRIGSYYHGFPGYLDQVRISTGVLEFRRARFQRMSDRACFVRNEPRASLRLNVTNLMQTRLTKGKVIVSIPGLDRKETPISNLSPGQTRAVDYPLDLSLRPDTYHLVARLSVQEPQPYESEDRFTIRIVPRRPPDRFPVLMWGVGSPANVLKEMDRLKRIGFDHVLGFRADYGKIFDAGSPTDAAAPEEVEQTRQMLDEALANDMTIVASLSPGAAMRGREEFQRIDRNGQPHAKEDICGLFPELQKYCYNVGASVARSYGHFPAWGAAMIHTEVRGHANPCFHQHDRDAFRKHAGIDIPPQVSRSRGVDYTKLPDFPDSRVIPDDHPIYVYYRWYWKTGDGWNGLNTAVHKGLKSTGRRDVWTYHDPAVRVASVYGTGGQVDFLSQWTYSYPDPIRIGLATDEMLAMVAGVPYEQKVMKMTQIIWYRSQTAPPPAKPSDELPYQAPWELQQPDAPFITIPPMHLREAFWTKIARPIKGIMYHGWQSLVPCEPPRGYRFTHPETQHELARLVRHVVRPLGPTLLKVPGVKGDVAFLESFASEMFAKRGTYGWNGTWAGDAYHVTLYAHLQPEVVFDETIVGRGLDGFRVLVMPDCDVITETMAERIKAFQSKGGVIVGDERLTPAIKPDILLPVYQRTKRADKDKAALVALAAGLRKRLDPHYSRYVDSSNPEVIPYRRRSGDTDYVFVVNDRREYGQYVGQHGLVMAGGLPSDAELSIARPEGFVYDLVNSREVPSRRDGGTLRVDVHLGPCDGGLYMITSRAIHGVRIQAPEAVDRTRQAEYVIEVIDAAGRPIDAVVPLEVNIQDAEGRLAEFSGYYAAVDGRLEITLDIARNDPPGVWQITVRDLASGRTATHYMRVRGPKPWPRQKT